MKVDSSENITVSQSFSVQWRCFLQNLSLFFTMAEVRRGFLAAARDRIFNRFWQTC